MAKKQNGIVVRDLLKKAYQKLCEKYQGVEITFAEKLLTEIADDSDMHRTRVGYMGYTSARTLKFQDRLWVIARGEACGDYPADPYDSDILALEHRSGRKLTGAGNGELALSIRGSPYFRNSLVFGLADGTLGVSLNGKFGKEVARLLQRDVDKIVAQTPEYNREVFLASTLQNPVTRPMLYKHEAPEILLQVIESALTMK